MLMSQCTKAIGRTICSTALESKHGTTDQGTKGTIKTGKNMDLENTFGATSLATKANEFKTKSKGTGSICE